MKYTLETPARCMGSVTKLLTANLLRLRQSKLFWGTLAFMAGHTLWNIFDRSRLSSTTVDGILFDYCLVTGLVSALFSGLFLGTEYSEGTLRNKLMVGHPRFSVYFASLLTNMIAATLQSLTYLAVILGPGSLLLGPPTLPWSRILLLFLGTLATAAAFCAVYTAVGMLCSRRAAVVVCLAGAFALFGIMSGVDSGLSVPKYSVIGEGDDVFLVDNPDYGYAGGAIRPVYQFLDDALPFGQAIQYMYVRGRQDIDPEIQKLLPAEDLALYTSQVRPELDPLPLILYSLAVTTGITAAGAVLFYKKDLK